jgi:hypothetical protein
VAIPSSAAEQIAANILSASQGGPLASLIDLTRGY